MTRFGPCIVLLSALLPGAALRAQERVSIKPRSRPAAALSPRNARLRFDVRLVQIPVLVTDMRGKPMIDLGKDAFHIYQDDVEQPIAAFSLFDTPISATVVFDSSRSMKSHIAEARDGVEQFLKTSLPGDDFALVRFSDRAEILSGFTPDPDEISRRLGFVEPHGWTALFDALCLGAHESRKGGNRRKVLVVFSDGGDNNSRYSESELASLLREAEVEVYALSMFEKPRSLERLASETGGRAFWVRRIDDLPDAIATLSEQVRSEYLLGYTPGALQNDGKYHRVRVEVKPPAGMQRVQVSWRRGYMAPGE